MLIKATDHGSACARLATDATSSSSRLMSAVTGDGCVPFACALPYAEKGAPAGCFRRAWPFGADAGTIRTDGATEWKYVFQPSPHSKPVSFVATFEREYL